MTAFESIDQWARDGALPAVVVLLGAGLLVRFVHWVAQLYRAGIDDQVRSAARLGHVASEQAKHTSAVAQAVAWSVAATVYLIAGVLAFHLVGVPLTTLIAPATIAGVGLGFGAQQVVGDLLAGFFLFAERQFGFGDVIRISQPGQHTGVTGTVEELTLRVTKLRTAQGEMVIVPNSALRQVTNLSKEWSRAVVDIPVAVGEDLELASHVLREAAQAAMHEPEWQSMLLSDPVVVGVEAFEIGYVVIRLVARTLPGHQFDVARELRMRCATALRLAGVATMAGEPATS
jgi:moderate conductance mechanosensitive channel